jgi:hypothetical protein
MRKKYSPSPIFLRLAEYYINPDAYNYWKGEPLEFKVMVKNFLIEHINASIEPYVKSLPFLNINFPKYGNWLKYEIEFEENIKAFLNERKIVKVFLWKKEKFEGSIIPLSGEEIKIRYKDLANLFPKGGFEISLGACFNRRRILTTFAHEVAHTYFYDIHQDPPRCLISKEILTIRIWYQEFEGMAFDLGRELLLPRKRFIEYVNSKYKEASLKNFLEMCSNLNISKEILSQRLIKDLKLWDACIFWGKVNCRIKDPDNISESLVVEYRSKRKSDYFRNLSLKKEFKNINSELTANILKHARTAPSYKIEEYPISILIKGKKKYQTLECFLQIMCGKPFNGERRFIALLRPVIVKR